MLYYNIRFLDSLFEELGHSFENWSTDIAAYCSRFEIFRVVQTFHFFLSEIHIFSQF